MIASLCQPYGAVAFADEIYEHITFDGAMHVPIATIRAWKIARSPRARSRRPTPLRLARRVGYRVT